jgi:hypothetical protein
MARIPAPILPLIVMAAAERDGQRTRLNVSRAVYVTTHHPVTLGRAVSSAAADLLVMIWMRRQDSWGRSVGMSVGW